MTGLLSKLASKFRHGRRQRRRCLLPETIWVHLVACLEESGRGTTPRPNSYQVVLPENDYALLQPNLTDFERKLGYRLAAEAHNRGYTLCGPAAINITADKVDTVLVKACSMPDSLIKSNGDTTIIFHRSRKKEEPLALPRELAVLNGPDRGSMLTIWGDNVLVGRSETNHVVLHDEGVSRVHLRIWRSNNEEYVEDLDSLNGTWVNGHRVQKKTRLKVGDKITLGSTTLEYRG